MEKQPFEGFPDLQKIILFFATHVDVPTPKWNDLLDEINKVCDKANVVPSWLPIDENLKDHTEYLIWNASKMERTVGYFKHGCWYAEDGLTEVTGRITHYQILPEPPKA